ncbi:MAG: metallophosphoesterase [Candidatus Nanoarchaeia archaeon]
MKLAFLSDLHLGFAYGSERQEDSFEGAKQAFALCLREKPDLILLGGDIFHDKIPRQEVLGKAIELFTEVNKKLKKVLVIKKIDKDKKVVEKKELIPAIVGIWGTHERRHENSTNPAQLLEKAGLVHLLHCESILVELGYEKLGIHGLSGVPEDYAKAALENWSPKPFENSHNVLLLHQNIKELIPAETSAISFTDLPEKFDLYLLGHFHWRREDEQPKTRAPILIPGSTVVTQMSQNEASSEKGFFIIELPPEKALRTITFKPLITRPAHYLLVELREKRPAEIQFTIQQAIAKALSLVNTTGLKPIIKVKVKGTLARGFSPTDLELSQIYKDFVDKAILDIDKSDLQADDAETKPSLLQDLKEKKITADQLGLELIRKNLPLPIETEKLEQLFNYLANGETEKAEELLRT